MPSAAKKLFPTFPTSRWSGLLYSIKTQHIAQIKKLLITFVALHRNRCYMMPFFSVLFGGCYYSVCGSYISNCGSHISFCGMNNSKCGLNNSKRKEDNSYCGSNKFVCEANNPFCV
jgi:hypothetical protein